MFWFRIFLRHPILTIMTLRAAWLSSKKASEWIVVIECDDNGNTTRESSWPKPATFETAMRRAQLENFQWLYCCAGKDEGTCVENPKWVPQPQ